MKKEFVWAGAVGAVALAVAAVLLQSGSVGGLKAPPGQLLDYGNADVVALGQEIYAGNCASCHGADLEGQGDWRTPDADGYLPAPPHDASGHTWHHPDALLVDITTRGSAAVVGGGYQSRMPGFADSLSEEEIRAVLAYIKSTWPDQVIEAHNDINSRSAGN